MSSSEETVVIQTEEETQILQEQQASVSQEELAIMEQEMLLFQSPATDTSDEEFVPDQSKIEFHTSYADSMKQIKELREKMRKAKKSATRKLLEAHLRVAEAQEMARINHYKENRLKDYEQILIKSNQKLKAKKLALKAKEEELAIRESLLEQFERKIMNKH